MTLPKEAAETIAKDAKHYAAMPQNSSQHSILTFAPSHLVGLVGRTRPFMGQLGSCPAISLPDSHNAGDFGPRRGGAADLCGGASLDWLGVGTVPRACGELRSVQGFLGGFLMLSTCSRLSCLIAF